MAESITCPRCGMTSHHPMDAEMEWCDNCKSNHSAMAKEEPIFFNAIIQQMKRVALSKWGGGRFSMGLEQFEEEGGLWWRAFLRDGSRLVKSSGRLHLLPGDALRELAELIDERAP